MTDIPRKILFICKGNWFRSQIAEALYNNLTDTQDAISAGTYTGAPDEPEGVQLSKVLTGGNIFAVMDSHGFDLRQKTTTKLTPELLASADIVVSMAEEPYIPDFLKNDSRVIWWDIANPPNVTRDFVEETYQKLYTLVSDLIGAQRK